VITSEPEQILKARRIVLPGVGAFADGMSSLEKMGLTGVIFEAVQKEIPLLGICLGMQMLFSTSEEAGLHRGLDLIPGKVRRFQLPASYKVPHMGWNQIEIQRPDPLLQYIDDLSSFYFVHSYYVDPEEKDLVLALTEYGLRFASIVGRENVYGIQFHPEKSSVLGLKILKNFGRMVQKC